MKMGTIASPWRYDAGAENAIGAKLVPRGSQQHYIDCRVEATKPMAYYAIGSNSEDNDANQKCCADETPGRTH